MVGAFPEDNPTMQTFALRSQGCNSMEGNNWTVATCGRLWFAALGWTRNACTVCHCQVMSSNGVFWILLVPGFIRVVNYRDISKPNASQNPHQEDVGMTALVPGSSTFAFAGESWSQPWLLSGVCVNNRSCAGKVLFCTGSERQLEMLYGAFHARSLSSLWYYLNIQYIVVRRWKVHLFREAQVSIEVS